MNSARTAIDEQATQNEPITKYQRQPFHCSRLCHAYPGELRLKTCCQSQRSYFFEPSFMTTHCCGLSKMSISSNEDSHMRNWHPFFSSQPILSRHCDHAVKSGMYEWQCWILCLCHTQCSEQVPDNFVRNLVRPMSILAPLCLSGLSLKICCFFDPRSWSS